MEIKRTYSKSQCSEMDGFINRLLISDHNDDYSWIQPHVSNTHIQKYFIDLHKHITYRNIYHLKGYQSLIDGLYILLKGQIKFMPEQTNVERCKLKKMKSSKSSLNSSGAIIAKPWSVFQCSFQNCTAMVESYVLRITEEQATLSHFCQLYTTRNQLYSNRFLSQDHHQFYDIPVVQKPFYVSLKIHSYFSYKTYNFRQLLTLASPAIVVKGSAKLKISGSYTCQFDKYGVLLPNLRYQVSSSQITLMIIENNETLRYDFELSFNKFKKLQQYSYASSVSRTQISTPYYKQISPSHKQMKSTFKQKVKLFKQSEHYSIISTFLCKKSLKFARRHNIIHNTKQKKQNRCKNPLVLFNIVNQKSKISTPKFQTLHSIDHSDTGTKNFSSHKVSSQSEDIKTHLLKKIKLEPEYYNKYMNKHKKMPFKQNEQNNLKLKRTLNLTLDKIQDGKVILNSAEYFFPKCT